MRRRTNGMFCMITLYQDATRIIRAKEASRQSSVRLLIIGHTSDADPDSVRKCLEAGMDSVLVKPCKRQVAGF